MREIKVLINRDRIKTNAGNQKGNIVPGDSDVLPWVKNELGKACVTCMKESSGKYYCCHWRFDNGCGCRNDDTRIRRELLFVRHVEALEKM